MRLVKGEQASGLATIELMKRTQRTIKPKAIVDKYVEILAAKKKHDAADLLWKQFHTGRIKVLADGSKTLAMIWDNVWAKGNGGKMPKSKLKIVSTTTLKNIYQRQDFLPSAVLGGGDNHL
ncbi:MAG TPA: hypothetical protein VNG71_13445 [Pyrinomonadaceae bacterium]|nr:hypothetical protein [Pyrinomonadaceae bacterium]